MPLVQVAIVNSRAVHVIAGSRERWKLAGEVKIGAGVTRLTAAS